MNDLKNWLTESCRFRLKEVDLKFMKFVLSSEGFGSDALQELEFDKEFRDSLLDNPALLRAILNHPGPLPITSGLYFYTLLRRALRDAGIEDRDLVDYMVSVLVRRIHVDSAFNHTISDGKTYLYIADSLQKIEEAEAIEQFLLRVKLANQTLFLTGLFGEHLRYREQRKGAPNLSFYESIGRAQYRAASEYPLANEFNLKEVFAVLGTSFVGVRCALNVFSDRLVSLGEPFWGSLKDEGSSG